MKPDEGQQHCPYCQELHPITAKFCPQTGKELIPAIRACPVCGYTVIQDQEHCPNFGSWLQAEEQGISLEQEQALEEEVEPALPQTYEEKPDELVVDTTPSQSITDERLADEPVLQLSKQRGTSQEVEKDDKSNHLPMHVSLQEQIQAWVNHNLIKLLLIVCVLISGFFVGSSIWPENNGAQVRDVAVVSPAISPWLG